MSSDKKVIIEAYVSTGAHGCTSTDYYETEYTEQEWHELTESERDLIIRDILDCHLGNNMDCGAWVKECEE